MKFTILSPHTALWSLAARHMRRTTGRWVRSLRRRAATSSACGTGCAPCTLQASPAPCGRMVAVTSFVPGTGRLRLCSATTDIAAASGRCERASHAALCPDFCHGVHQAFGLGDKAELLAAVRQPEGPQGPTHVQLTSDLATPAVLHWGVKRGKRGEWLRPPPEV